MADLILDQHSYSETLCDEWPWDQTKNNMGRPQLQIYTTTGLRVMVAVAPYLGKMLLMENIEFRKTLLNEK